MASLGHIARESSDITRLAQFYKEENGIETLQKSLPDRKVKQVFFFCPDGNGLQVTSRSET